MFFSVFCLQQMSVIFNRGKDSTPSKLVKSPFSLGLGNSSRVHLLNLSLKSKTQLILLSHKSIIDSLDLASGLQSLTNVGLSNKQG